MNRLNRVRTRVNIGDSIYGLTRCEYIYPINGAASPLVIRCSVWVPIHRESANTHVKIGEFGPFGWEDRSSPSNRGLYYGANTRRGLWEESPSSRRKPHLWSPYDGYGLGPDSTRSRGKRRKD